MLELWHAVVLGLVEGITEYLPISSTGHLILTSGLLGLDKNPATKQALDDFQIVIQGGAILAVVGLYWPSMVSMLKGLVGKDAAGLRLFRNLVIAFIPSAVIGLLFKDVINRYLFHSGPVLLALVLGAVYMVAAEWWSRGRLGWGRKGYLPDSRGRTIEEVTAKQALFIGMLQIVSLWPGTSRSMMTITGGLFVGLRPSDAARFSFLLGLPTLTAATLYALLKNMMHARETGGDNLFQALGVVPCLVGMAVAAVSAVVAVRWLVGFLNHHGLTFFAWYRVLLAVVIAALAGAGVVTIGQSEPEAAGTSVTSPQIDWSDTRPALPQSATGQ